MPANVAVGAVNNMLLPIPVMPVDNAMPAPVIPEFADSKGKLKDSALQSDDVSVVRLPN